VLQIQCILIRKGGTRAEIGGVNYHFRPLTDAADAPHVCDVTAPEHIERFLALADAYRIHDPSRAAGGVKRPDVPPPANAPTGSAGPEPSAGGGATSIDAIRALSTRDLKAVINTFSTEDLREALAAEEARGDDKPRSTWIAVVKAHLGDAA
jgi:hypothetical protein